jgi:hypothetical protein
MARLTQILVSISYKDNVKNSLFLLGSPDRIRTMLITITEYLMTEDSFFCATYAPAV